MTFPHYLFLAVCITGVVYVLYRLLKLPSWTNEYIGSFFPVLLAVFLLRSFVAEPFRIPSGSMLPTLYIGDFILVNKFSYGVRWPLNNKVLMETGEPERGDVFVFHYPRDEKINYIKRVVGLPGDTIEYKNKRLTINGTEIPVAENGRFIGDVAGEAGLDAAQLTETLGDIEHEMLWEELGFEQGFKAVVPEGQYFAMGDNRDHSSDSRYWGFVENKHLVGRAMFIWFNYNGMNGVNWDRIGTSLNK